jgi:hypothetical protein
MATARDRAFKILTEREIYEILKAPAEGTPREAGVPLDISGMPGFDDGFHSSPDSSLTNDECEGGTYPPYWGTWGAV